MRITTGLLGLSLFALAACGEDHTAEMVEKCTAAVVVEAEGQDVTEEQIADFCDCTIETLGDLEDAERADVMAFFDHVASDYEGEDEEAYERGKTLIEAKSPPEKCLDRLGM
ncbi:hypothetical protein [Parvularcula marina]|uniref:hypothetical protein n=1 Tax=Parvularcula marina TaxID=2292771 RepID=UPI0035171F75